MESKAKIVELNADRKELSLTDKVTAIVPSAEGCEIIEGYITSRFMDDVGHEMARIMTDAGARNAHIKCVNPSDATIAAFKELVANVNKLTEEGNAEVKALVERHNASIKELESNFYGSLVEIPEELNEWIEVQKAQSQAAAQAF